MIFLHIVVCVLNTMTVFPKLNLKNHNISPGVQYRNKLNHMYRDMYRIARVLPIHSPRVHILDVNNACFVFFRRLIQSLNGDADKCPSGRVQHHHIQPSKEALM